MSYKKYRMKINRLQKEIDELRKQQIERLGRMYDLGLTPFRGYYEMLLKKDKERE